MERFSIIVLLYNADPVRVKFTLESIMRQSFQDYEIILSDDGSVNDPFEEIELYFKEKHFTNYLFVKNKVNAGTVLNIYGALKRARGEYIKLIGAGDMLYSETTLQDVYDFMSSNNYNCCFGRMKSFSFADGYNIVPQKFYAPKYLKEYTRKKINKKRIFRDMLMHENWIYGATMFFKKPMLLMCMKTLLGRVKYTEDIFQLMIFLRKDYMRYLDKYVVWYELGYGFSNSGNVNFIKAIRADQESYVSYIESKCPNNKQLLKLIEYRRNRRAGVMNASFLTYLEIRRWMLFKWFENTFIRIKDVIGFLDKPEAFLKQLNIK